MHETTWCPSPDEPWLLWAMLERTRDAVALTDADPQGPGPRILCANRAFFALTGHEPDSRSVATAGRLLETAENDCRGELERLRAALQRAEPVRAVLRTRRADGSMMWVELDLTPLSDEPGAAARFVAVQRDVSKRVRRERLLAVTAPRGHDLLAVVDASGRVAHVEPMQRHALGHDPAALVGTAVFDLVHPDNAGELRAAIADPASAASTSALRLRDADGAWRWLQVDLVDRRADSAVKGWVLAAREVPDRLGVAGQATRLLESVKNACCILDEQWRITALNARAVQLFEQRRDELLGRSVWEAVPAAVGTVIERSFRRAVTTGEPVAVQTFHPPHDRWYEVRAVPGAQALVVHFHDVTDRVRSDAEQRRCQAGERTAYRVAEATQDALARAVAHDALTGLDNRTELERHIRDLLAHRTASVTLLFFDVDDFKIVNASLGHTAGDAVLRHVAARLTQRCRPPAKVGRFGGDEFFVVLEDVGLDDAVASAERLRQAINEPYDLEGRTVTLSASVGVAAAAADDTVDTLIRNADTALSHAKRAGRDHVAVFDDSLHQQALERLNTEQDLRITSGGEQLDLVYQPMFDLAGGQRVGAEALLRWRHPTRGLLTPGAFIEVAEDTGLIVPIGRWVLDRACQTVVRRRPVGPTEMMWVNVSAPQLIRPDFVQQVADAQQRHGVRAGELGIEITERALITRPDDVAAQMAELHRLGVRIAIDDFGTGYSSMASLQHYPVDVLKIDRAFVARLHTPDGHAIVDAIVQLAHALGASASAEGVETPSQLDAVRAIGCDTAAGYLLAEPRPVDVAMPDRLRPSYSC